MLQACGSSWLDGTGEDESDPQQGPQLNLAFEVASKHSHGCLLPLQRCATGLHQNGGRQPKGPERWRKLGRFRSPRQCKGCCSVADSHDRNSRFPQGQGAAVDAKSFIVASVRHGVDSVEPEGPEHGGQPASDQRRTPDQLGFSGRPRNEHGKTPAQRQNGLWVGKPALCRWVEKDRWKGQNGKEQAELDALNWKADHHQQAHDQQDCQ